MVRRSEIIAGVVGRCKTKKRKNKNNNKKKNKKEPISAGKRKSFGRIWRSRNPAAKFSCFLEVFVKCQIKTEKLVRRVYWFYTSCHPSSTYIGFAMCAELLTSIHWIVSVRKFSLLCCLFVRSRVGRVETFYRRFTLSRKRTKSTRLHVQSFQLFLDEK